MYISFKVHGQGLLWQQIDLDRPIWNRHAFLSQATKFQNSRARRSWKRAITYGTLQTRNFGGNPLNMTWIEDFPCLLRNFSLCYNLIFVVSPDGFNSNPKKFFWATHSHVVQEHPDKNEFCSNARFPFLGMCSVLMGKVSYKSVHVISF